MHHDLFSHTGFAANTRKLREPYTTDYTISMQLPSIVLLGNFIQYQEQGYTDWIKRLPKMTFFSLPRLVFNDNSTPSTATFVKPVDAKCNVPKHKVTVSVGSGVQ